LQQRSQNIVVVCVVSAVLAGVTHDTAFLPIAIVVVCVVIFYIQLPACFLIIIVTFYSQKLAIRFLNLKDLSVAPLYLHVGNCNIFNQKLIFLPFGKLARFLIGCF
jgi:hypothetical protein